MGQKIRFSNFLKNGDVILTLQCRAGQEPLMMKREDSLDFVLKFLKAYGVDEGVVREVEKTVKEKWKKFDVCFRKTECWEDVKGFSEL